MNNTEITRVRHDAQNLMTALATAINSEETFIKLAKSVIARFGNTDHTSNECRQAVYSVTDNTDNYDEMLMMLMSSEKRIRTLQQGANFVNSWKEELK